MPKSLHLALSLIRIPHLALSLFVFPLVLSLVLVAGQLVVTGIFIKAAGRDADEVVVTSKRREENNLLRRLLYSDGRRRDPIQVCRWTTDPTDGEEPPPGDACQPDRLDVALRASDPATFDARQYASMFDGHVDRLHVCRECAPDIVISFDEKGRAVSKSSSAFGMIVLMLPYESSVLTDKKISFRRDVEKIRWLLGSLYFTVPEIPGGIGVSDLKTSIPVTLNITFLVVIALWLALKAHRKVLDYFSHNNVLMPLVAACGKNRFYAAIWSLTALRVFCFLGASIPLVYFGLQDVSDAKAFSSLKVSTLQVFVWLLTLVTSLGLATMMASLSELKHRQSVLSFTYRYVPILFALLGAVVWSGSFLFIGDSSSLLRTVITVLPIVGMTPIFVAPILNLPVYMMLAHALFSTILLVVALRHNARWFAAHLEEV